MSTYQAVFFVFACIVLFLYGLKGFSEEIKNVGGERLKKTLGGLTRNRWSALGLGALITAIIQSSSAVSAMTVALVDAGAISFTNSLAVLLGAGIGTSSTVWLVSLNFMDAGIYFMVIGFVIGSLPFRISLIGKSLFYFGFILFALLLLSDALAPVKESPLILETLSSVDHIMVALLAGLLITALVQSSSVVVGLCAILVQGEFLQLSDGIGILIGAKVGSTSTALLASLKMSESARLTALSNFVFFISGAIVFLPFTSLLEDLAISLSSSPGIQVAYCQLIFSVFIALIYVPFIGPFARLMLRWRPIDQDS